MKILLVEPKYYTAYPPLALLRFAAYHRKRGDEVQLVRGCEPCVLEADRIYVTSLFTFAWLPVKEAISYYRALLPKAYIVLGGIYASLMPEHAMENCRPDKLVVGLAPNLERENILPDYSLVASTWQDTSIVFASRGCIRKCPYCAVPQIEGALKGRKSIKKLIWPGHKKVVFWDNNFLALDNWRDILAETRELKITVDFNQGLDARFMTLSAAKILRESKVEPVRLAYDRKQQGQSIKKAINNLKVAGYSGRRIIIYCLYNYNDSPKDFWERICDLMQLGVAAYPMRYQKLDSLEKNGFVSKNWTKETVEMVARAQRVIGRGGAFPPYEGLVNKLINAKDFHEAFELRQPKKRERVPLSCSR